MSSNSESSYRIIFLRGINVGGRHKVPMKELIKVLEDAGFSNITTILNTGNIIARPDISLTDFSDHQLSELLETYFGFTIPVISLSADEFLTQMNSDPFKDVRVTDQTRLYASLVASETAATINTPWISADGTLTILKYDKNMIFSHLDLGFTKTPKGMEELEKVFGKRITTRNWNTMLKIRDRLMALD